MIGSDNEPSRSRLTGGIIAKMYDILTVNLFVRCKTEISQVKTDLIYSKVKVLRRELL